MTDKAVDSKPIITDYSQSEYNANFDGIIYLTVGTAVDKLNKVKEKPSFYVIQKSEFGFLNVKIENYGTILVEEFYTKMERY